MMTRFKRPSGAATSTGSRALVIGHGFIGARITSFLIEAGIGVTVLTRTPSQNLVDADDASLRVVAGDCSDRASLELSLADVDHVIYAAGGLMPAQSNADPARDVALALPPLLCVLETLRHMPDIRLTFLSSGGTIYGKPHYLPIDESHPTSPITSYGVLKLASEHYIGMYRDLYGLRANVLRCSNVYGPGQQPDRGQGAVATFAGRLLSGMPVVLFGDGGTIRDYVFVDDVAAVILRLAEADAFGHVCNVGSEVGTSLRFLLELLVDLTGQSAVLDRRPPRNLDIAEVVLDATRIRGLVEVEWTKLEQGLERTVASLHGDVQRLANANIC